MPFATRTLVVPPVGALMLAVKALVAKLACPDPVITALCDDPLELFASIVSASRKVAVFAFVVVV